MQSSKQEIVITSEVSIELVLVEGGRFEMGSNEHAREQPIHEVEVPSFYIGKYQVTQRQWEVVMGNNPSRFQGGNHPVEMVSWKEVQAYIKRLHTKTKMAFRLPTEAEWEYAARGGRYSQGFEYSGSDKLKQVGWYRENSERETHEVGLLLGNELGLYDMSGNVREWCEDDYHSNYKGASLDGSAWIAPDRGASRVLRGGSSFSLAVSCRTAYRRAYRPGYRRGNIGFRMVLPLQSVG